MIVTLVLAVLVVLLGVCLLVAAGTPRRRSLADELDRIDGHSSQTPARWRSTVYGVLGTVAFLGLPLWVYLAGLGWLWTTAAALLTLGVVAAMVAELLLVLRGRGSGTALPLTFRWQRRLATRLVRNLTALRPAPLLRPITPARVPPPSAPAARRADTRLLVVQRPPGSPDLRLWDVAVEYLGSRLRYRDLIELNRGRRGPTGAPIDEDAFIGDGWTLLVPGDARGPGLVELPARAARRSAGSAAPDPGAEQARPEGRGPRVEVVVDEVPGAGPLMVDLGGVDLSAIDMDALDLPDPPPPAAPDPRPVAPPRPVSRPAVEPRRVPPPAVEPRPVAPPVAQQHPGTHQVAEPHPLAPPVAEPRPVAPRAAESHPLAPPDAEPHPLAPPVGDPRRVTPPVEEPRRSAPREPHPFAPPAAEPHPVAPPAAEPHPLAPPVAEPGPVAPRAAEPHPLAPPAVPPSRWAPPPPAGAVPAVGRRAAEPQDPGRSAPGSAAAERPTSGPSVAVPPRRTPVVPPPAGASVHRAAAAEPPAAEQSAPAPPTSRPPAVPPPAAPRRVGRHRAAEPDDDGPATGAAPAPAPPPAGRHAAGDPSADGRATAASPAGRPADPPADDTPAVAPPGGRRPAAEQAAAPSRPVAPPRTPRRFSVTPPPGRRPGASGPPDVEQPAADPAAERATERPAATRSATGRPAAEPATTGPQAVERPAAPPLTEQPTPGRGTVEPRVAGPSTTHRPVAGSSADLPPNGSHAAPRRTPAPLAAERSASRSAAAPAVVEPADVRRFGHVRAALAWDVVHAELLADGLLALLDGLRHHRAHQRPRDAGVPVPDVAAALVEESARVGADSAGGAFLEMGLRLFARLCAERGRPAPDLVGAHLGPERLELRLATPDRQAPAPFEATQSGSRWWLDRDVEPGAGADVAPRLPGLVSIGPDSFGRVLVNLPAAGVVSIDGPPAGCRLVATALAVELVVKRWSEAPLVDMVGFGPELVGLSPHLRHHDRLSQVLEQPVHGDVVVLASPPDDAELAALRASAASAWFGVPAVVVVGEHRHALWRLRLDRNGMVSCPDLDVVVGGQALSLASAAALSRLVRTERSVEMPGVTSVSGVAVPRVVDPALAEVVLRLFGRPRLVRGDREIAVADRVVELVAHLALCGASSPAEVAAALWPRGTDVVGFAALLTDAALALGESAAGEPLLRMGDVLELAPQVQVDLHLFLAAATTGADDVAAALVDDAGTGAEDPVAELRRWSWTARLPLVRRLPGLVVDVLARRGGVPAGEPGPPPATRPDTPSHVVLPDPVRSA